MKAKNAARQINALAREKNLQGRWDAVLEQVKAGKPEAELLAAADLLQKEIHAVLEGPSREYLAHLVQSLGTGLKERHTVKTASVRAAVLAAEQAWKAFHARLDPLPARFVAADAFRRTLEHEVPGISMLAWSMPGQGRENLFSQMLSRRRP